MKEQGYQYTTDLLVIGCGFSGMWAAMRARDFLGDVLVVDKGPRDWGGLGGLSGVGGGRGAPGCGGGGGGGGPGPPVRGGGGGAFPAGT